MTTDPRFEVTENDYSVTSEPSRPPLANAVLVLLARAAWINKQAASSATGGGIDALSWEEATRVLADLREAMTTLSQIDAALVRHLYLTGPHGDIEVEGVGVVKVYRTNDRKDWDHDEWKQDVRAAILEERAIAGSVVDTASGEVIDLYDLLEQVQNVHGAQAPKVTALRALGLNPEAYCDERPGKPSVQITRPSG